MTQEATRLKKMKRTLWALYCESLDPLHHARFARSRNQLRKLTRELRSKYEAKLVGALKQNPKAFWSYANSRLKTRSRVDVLKDENGSVVTGH